MNEEPEHVAPIVDDADTTYRVKGNRTATLKARALAAYFPPHEIRWLPGKVSNGRALAMAYITARAVADRLDYSVGPDNWQTSYEELDNGSVKCTLSVRFIAESNEWIAKTDVGSKSEQPDDGDQMKAAFSDALKRAAVQFGIGRYLYNLKSQWCAYDGKRFTEEPHLPDGCIPTAYRPCGVEKARKVIAILEGALDGPRGANVPRDKWPGIARRFLSDYGYEKPDGAVIQNRHADAMLERLNKWVGEIAKGNVNCPFSPIYDPNAGPTGKPLNQQQQQSEEPKPAPEPVRDEPKKEEAPKEGKKKGKMNTKPVNGAELLARIEAKDLDLAREGRIERGALKSHVIECGAAKTYSADILRWAGGAIDNAVKWVTEFVADLPEPGTYAYDEKTGTSVAAF